MKVIVSRATLELVQGDITQQDTEAAPIALRTIIQFIQSHPAIMTSFRRSP